jgi:hypothetical protein
LGGDPLAVVAHPLAAWHFLWRYASFNYLFAVFSPVLFLPFLAWIKLLPAIPFFLQHMLSLRPSDLSMQYHYTAEIIPFIFVSLIYAIKKILSVKIVSRHSFVFGSVLAALILFNGFTRGPYIGEAFRINREYRADRLDYYKEELVKKVPVSAGVVATFEFLPRLANRSRLYSLHHPYLGFYTLSNRKYTLPKDAEYALVDFNDRLTFKGFYLPEGYRNLQSIFLDGQWQVLDAVDSLVLFKRPPAKKGFICSQEKSSARLAGKELLRVEDAVSLREADFECLPGEDFIEAKLTWQCLKNTNKDIQIAIEITGPEGKIIKRLIHPIGYRIFPTQSWRSGEVFKETLRINIPGNLLKNGIFVMMGFSDFVRGDTLRISSNGKDYTQVKIKNLKCGN